MATEMIFEQVVARYTQTVYGVALTHTACQSDADDVFQEVFSAYWRSKPQVHDEEHLKAWLIRTTLNFCLKLTQSGWAKKTMYLDGNAENTVTSLERGAGEEYSLEHESSVQGELPSADFTFESDQQAALYAALRELPTPYKTVVQLFYFEDLSIAQIATTLGEEQGAVKTRLSRARAQLREMLKEGNRHD